MIAHEQVTAINENKTRFLLEPGFLFLGKGHIMLTIATQKSGRLSKQTRKLLTDAGMNFCNDQPAQLKSTALNFPIQVLFLRDDDIPDCVSRGVADAGIVGENVCFEKDKPIKIVEKLGFAKCRLSIAMPKQAHYESAQDLNGLTIATSYPVTLGKFLKEKGIDASIQLISGSVEISPGIGLADAVFDIVSTGSTLISNGLKEVETVMKSESVLIAGQDLDVEKSQILEKLLFRIRAVKKAGSHKYILLNAPNYAIDEISRILPGVKSPTIMPLAMDGWSSVHTVIKEDEFWENIESLKNAGAQGILVVPIEKMII